MNFNYALSGNTLVLDRFFTTDVKNKVRDQLVRLTLYVPEGTVLAFDRSARDYIGRRTRTDRDLYRKDIANYRWQMGASGVLSCLDCPEQLPASGWEDGNGHIIIDENGVDINIKDSDDRFRMKIDQDGIEVKADPNNIPGHFSPGIRQFSRKPRATDENRPNFETT